MSRSFTYTALTLRVKASGESNREVWFLTAEEGLIRATVFGGPKSRLRAQAAPFHEGKLWVYHNPVRDSRKVTDFDVHSYRAGIRELYERAMTAAAVAETILASSGGGGNWQDALNLAGNVLDALEDAEAAACPQIALYFLWHWVEILGVKPEISACASCGAVLPDQDLSGACEVKGDGLIWYSAGKETLLCGKCMGDERSDRQADSGASFSIGPAAINRLKAIESIPPEDLKRAPSVLWSGDIHPLEQAISLSKAVLTTALGKRLSTWDCI